VSALILSIAAYDYFAAELAKRMSLTASASSAPPHEQRPPHPGEVHAETWRNAELGAIERKRFPDGEHYLRLVDDVNDRHVVLVGGTIDDAATLELYDLACAAVENGARTLTLLVPWFGYSTMERAVLHGEAVVAKTRARLLSSIPRPKLGSQVLLFDLHSEGIPHYFEGTIRPFHVYGKTLVESLARELAGDDFVIGSTDAGRAKWVESLANDLGVRAAFVYKRRLSGETTEVTAISTSLHGETVVIYDDMIRTGGSLMNAARAYREAGAGRVFAIATHGVFPGDALERIVASRLFEAIACTDSHPNALALAGPDLIVRPAADLFVPLLERNIGG
jgi:ribose-phosphate pyrophosphokinase